MMSDDTKNQLLRSDLRAFGAPTPIGGTRYFWQDACDEAADAIERLERDRDALAAENARLRNDLRVAEIKLKDRAHPGDERTRDPASVLATLGFWPECGCGECYAIHCLSEALAENAKLREALRRNAVKPSSEVASYCSLCQGSWASDRPDGEWHERGCLAAPKDAP